jgi:hypothetical protein
MYEKTWEGSGSAPLTNGSGSGRPKNMRILRIRILNTGGITDSDLDRRGEEGDALLQPVGQGVLQQVPEAEDHT